ncbi:hypothetical protein TrLO_g5789 [Triparma laevis f. longispina]|uniref:Uncharacterized protein n=1 Tax=Triparma laevis f. longispina TaxID=1714387 RepID=A0A9W7FUM4_9STRA|nr:hypothetical protein TrLO_g5789 [Triparma laevis f. longispina]
MPPPPLTTLEITNLSASKYSMLYEVRMAIQPTEDKTTDKVHLKLLDPSIKILEGGLGVRSLGDFSFWMCPKLKEVYLPMVETDVESAFYETKIITLEIKDFEGDYGSDWEKVGTRLWNYGKQSLVHLILSDPKVKVMNEESKISCSNNLTKVTLLHVEEVGPCIFYFCSRLCEIQFPKVKELGYNCLDSCNDLEVVNCPSLEVIGSSSFESCLFALKLVLPMVKTVHLAAFYECYDLRHLQLHPEFEIVPYSDGYDPSSVYPSTFDNCYTLQALAASTNFQDHRPHNLGTLSNGIRGYLKWRMTMDVNKEI